MTSVPVTILSFRSSLDSDRPFASQTQLGQISICLGAGDPGVYIEDTNNDIIKVGPAGYGTTAPNASYVGLSGNSVGEIWFDSNASPVTLRVWDGTDWATVSAGASNFAQTALLASGAILASGAVTATQADSATIASGAIFADTATLASGAILASGAVFADTATLASGAILASGAVTATTVIISGLPDPAVTESGVMYLTQTVSGTYPSGLFVRALDGWYHVG